MDLKQLCSYMFLLILSLTTSVFSLDDFDCGILPANIYEKGNTSAESITSPWHALVRGPFYFHHATLISRNLVIFNSGVRESSFKDLIDFKRYTVHLGISYKKRADYYHTHSRVVSRLYYKQLRNWTHWNIQTTLMILVLSEPVSISEFIMPACVDWSMQYPLQNSDILEYEGAISDKYLQMLRGPSKCIGRDECINIFGNIRDIDNDTVCCEKPESPPDIRHIESSGSVITSEHNGLRFLKAIMFNINSYHKPHYIYTDINSHIQWIQSIYKNHTEMCPPVKSYSVQIKCTFEGKETDCIKKSEPGTKLIPDCTPMYRSLNGTDEKSIGLSCLPNGKWSDLLYDCKPKLIVVHDTSTYPDTETFVQLVLIKPNDTEKIQFQIQPIPLINVN